MIENNILNYYHNICRVIEIAKVGEFSIGIINNDEDFPRDKFTIECRSIVRASGYPNISINNLMDMNIELQHGIKYFSRQNKIDTPDIVSKRISEARSRKIEDIYDSASKHLLETATKRLGFVYYDIQMVLKIANAIARLDSADKIKAEHIAEAIQYRSVECKSYILV